MNPAFRNNRLSSLSASTPTRQIPLQIARSPGLAVPGQVLYAGVKGNPNHTGNALALKPAPRFGFAYAANDKTVLRGGYGIYWAPSFFSFQNAIGYSQSTSIVTSTDGNFHPSATLSNPYPNGLLQPTGNALGGLSGIGQAITTFSTDLAVCRVRAGIFDRSAASGAGRLRVHGGRTGLALASSE